VQPDPEKGPMCSKTQENAHVQQSSIGTTFNPKFLFSLNVKAYTSSSEAEDFYTSTLIWVVWWYLLCIEMQQAA
jgi:hypothetical protein